jgi:hypothetical protein
MVPGFSAQATLSPGLPDPAIWFEPSLVRIQPDTPSRAIQPLRLQAARNEVESFQIVLRSETLTYGGITAASSDLIHENGNVLSHSHISFYREQYLYLRTPSPLSPQAPGLWPDPLVPFVDPYGGKSVPPMLAFRQEAEGRVTRKLTGARFTGAPFTLWPRQSQALWVDVAIPRNTLPGKYSGTVTVMVPGRETVSCPVELRVWNFTLPDGPPLTTHFGSLDRLAYDSKLPADSMEYRTLQLRYAAELFAHRISPPLPAYLLPPVKPDGILDGSRGVEELRQYLDRFQIRRFPIPAFPFPDPLGENRKALGRYLKSYQEFLELQGWEKGAYYFPVEEPNSKRDYEAVRQYSQMLREHAPGIRLLVTEQPYPQDKSWGSLEKVVDIWCPLFAFFEEKSAKRAREQGQEIWSYTALCQTAPPYHPDLARVEARPTLWWQIDMEPLNFRLPLWLNWKYGITGLLYWSSIHWENPARDVWTDPAFRGQYNGEGFLLYPGNEAGIQGPIPSMRLKVLREGLEDYCYLVLLAQQGQKDFAENEAARLVTSWWEWEKNPNQLYQVRESLGSRLDALLREKPVQP